MRLWKLIFCLAAPFWGGCLVGSFPLAPKISSLDKDAITQTHFNASLGIAKEKPHNAFLFSEIQKLGLFDAIVLATGEPSCLESDLVVEFENYGNYANSLPFLTGLTLGFFPTIADDERGYIFTIYHCGAPEKNVRIDCRYKGTAIIGWYAIIGSLITPNQSFIHPFSGRHYETQEEQRFYDFLKWKIVQRQEDINQLLQLEAAMKN